MNLFACPRSVRLKKLDITHLVCKLWVRKVQKHLNSLFSGNAMSGYAKFTKLCKTIDIDVRNEP